MRRWIALALWLAGCATRDAELATVEIELRAPSELRGSDEEPRAEVVVRGDGARVIAARAAVPVTRGAVYVDEARRVVWIDGSGDVRMLDENALGPLISSGELVVWSEARELGATRVRALRVSEERVITIADARGTFAPLGLVGGELIALVGALDGGVAGLWLAPAREGASLECVTNCALRTGRPWGAEHVPPPADAASITIERDVVRFVDARGASHRAIRSAR